MKRAIIVHCWDGYPEYCWYPYVKKELESKARDEATKDAIIVMTKNVAESIGALDKRTHVNISYGSPNE